jgi:hypothetical protein
LKSEIKERKYVDSLNISPLQGSKNNSDVNNESKGNWKKRIQRTHAGMIRWG